MKTGDLDMPALGDEWKVTVCWGDIGYLKAFLSTRPHPEYEYNIESDLATTYAFCYTLPFISPIIVMQRYPKTPKEIGLLAHEACHAIDHIFHHIEEKVKDEAFAHLVGAVVERTLRYEKANKNI